jgi:hypothetical protein
MISAGALICRFDFTEQTSDVIMLMEKYRSVPMSFADACLVRMTEIFFDLVILTTDSDFHVYRRNGNQVVPCVTPR